MFYSLPTQVEIDGKSYSIRTDFRVILEIIEMLNDPDLNDADKVECIISMFYVKAPINKREAVEKCFEFMDMGEKPKKSPRLMDWEHDFNYIIAPVNRVLGFEARAVPYDQKKNTGGLHWWSFLAAYMEIGGDCVLSQIVNIRDKLARGKRLEKYERDWLKRNGDVVHLPQKYSKEQQEIMKQLGV